VLKKIRTILSLVNEIAWREDKKSPTRIENIRDIVGIISDLTYEVISSDDFDHSRDKLIDEILSSPFSVAIDLTQ